MTKEEELLLEWGRKREEIAALMKKYLSYDRWHNDEGKDLFRYIMEYGDAQAALATERCKQWMIKKLTG